MSVALLLLLAHSAAGQEASINLERNGVLELGFLSEKDILIRGRHESLIWSPREKERRTKSVDGIFSFAIPQEGKHFIATGRDKEDGFVVFDKASGKREKAIAIDNTKVSRLVAGKAPWIIGCFRDEEFEILDLENPKNPVRGALKEDPMARVRGMWVAAFSPDGSRVAVARNDNCLLVLEGEKWEKTKDFAAFHRTRIQSIAFLPDNRHFFSCDIGGVVLFWDLEKPDGLDRKVRLRAGLADIAVSRDGKTLFGASGERIMGKSTAMIRVYDIEKHEEQPPLVYAFDKLFSQSRW
jgi:WD40 repeat protein